MGGDVFRFASKPPASRHDGLTSLCGARWQHEPKKPNSHLQLEWPGTSFVSVRSGPAPRHGGLTSLCGAMATPRAQKNPKANLQLARRENVLRTNRGRGSE